MKKTTVFIALLFSFVAFSQTNQQRIQTYFDANLSKLGVTKQDASDWQIESEVQGAGTGITSVHVTQRHQGIPIFNAQSNVWVKNNQVINVANNFQSNIASRVNTTIPVLNVFQGITSAYSKLGVTQTPNFNIAETKSNKSFMLTDGLNEDLITAKLVYQTMTDKSLKLAWYYQFYTPKGDHLWDVRIDATNGAILEKTDLVISCALGGNHSLHNHNKSQKANENFSFENKVVNTSNSMLAVPGNYRVVPFNYTSPNHSPFQLITTAGDAIASPNGWHDANDTGGTNTSLQFTYTRGNNVLAQEDANGDNGNGIRPDGGASLNFDFPYVNGIGQTLQPTAYTDASSTNLFYMNNIMHDVWYKYGFNEASGNFQAKNYGKGGTLSATGDYVFADSQDGWDQATQTLDNANFSTPNDGVRPRMQMFMWTLGAPPTEFITINSPASIAGQYVATTNVFEGTDRIPVPVAPAGITRDFVLYTNALTAPSYSGNSACQPATNSFDLDNKIVLIRRGGCFFSNKVFNAQSNGAKGVIVMDSVPMNPVRFSMSSTGLLGITIPAVFVTKEIGDQFVAALATGTVNGKLETPSDLYLFADGSFDNGIIAHEYGHGISNKLIGGPTNSSCMTNYEQMGEGWSDWFSLMMGLRAGQTATDNVYVSTYAVNEPNATGPGIREFPYTTDMSQNPRTLNSSNNPDNSTTGYRYTIGETWATVMWDLTWAYVDKYGFDADVYNGTGGNNKVMKLALDALKLQACGTASMVSGRDNLFAADQATTGGADYCMIAEVFRRRGLGLNASSGNANNSGDQVEDFTAFPPGPNCTLAVNYFTNSDLINVSPNPSNGLFNVKIAKFSGKVTMQVVDINGRVILNQTNADFNNESIIDLSAFQSGIYVLKINADNLNYTQKLIKR